MSVACDDCRFIGTKECCLQPIRFISPRGVQLAAYCSRMAHASLRCVLREICEIYVKLNHLCKLFLVRLPCTKVNKVHKSVGGGRVFLWIFVRRSHMHPYNFALQMRILSIAKVQYFFVSTRILIGKYCCLGISKLNFRFVEKFW